MHKTDSQKNQNPKNMADVIVGLSQDALNKVFKQVYDRLGSSVFSGAGDVPDLNITYSWKILQAPVADLTPAAVQRSREYYLQRLQEPHHQKASYNTSLTQYAGEEGPAFMVYQDHVEVQITKDGKPGHPFSIKLDLKNRVKTSTDGKLGLTIFHVTVENAPDPGTKGLLEKYILPNVVKSLNSILSNLDIPRLQWENINLGFPNISISQGKLIVSLQLQNLPAGVTPALKSFPEGSEFFMLVSENIMQAAANKGVFNVSGGDSGRESASPLFAEWHYNFNLHTPRVGIDGAGIRVNLSLGGSCGARAGMDLGCLGDLAAGVGLGARTEPNPNVSLAVDVNASNKITVTTTSVSPFAIICYPSGGIVEWITGSLISLIVTAVASSASATLTGLLKGISFSVGEIPTATFSQSGVNFSFKPSGLRLNNFMGMLNIQGNVQINVS
jgi:hypothetical protein